MKKHIISILVFGLLASCSGDSVTNEFYDANDPDTNGTNSEVLITKLTATPVEDISNSTSIYINYDANDRVTSISDGEGAVTLVYSDGKLSNIASSDGTFNIEELYGSPYDAFEVGQVMDYDSNNNPILLSFPVEEWDDETYTYDIVFYTVEIYYDTTKPNPYFYTLEAAGVITVLDEVELNFSSNTQAPELLDARMLFPYNIMKRMVYKDGNNVVAFELEADYVFNTSNHPITGTITASSPTENETSVVTLEYTYKQ